MSIYVAATRQNDGKTVVSLGLLSALKKIIPDLGYMKPIGQQYKIIDGRKIDKDAVLMHEIFKFRGSLRHMSPIAVASGFTERYIKRGDRRALVGKIKESYRQLRRHHDFVLIEGTGHAGVGSVFDMSNADVAGLLKAKVILVSQGGIGKPIDEIMLNLPTFRSKGVEVLGVIVNKVRKEKFRKINRVVRAGLARKGIKVLGVIPYENLLSNPTIAELLEDLGGTLICGKNELHRTVERFVIGDMATHEASHYLSGGTLIIIPGNRHDFIFSALSAWVLGLGKKYHISGIIATYGEKPDQKLVNAIQRARIPLISVQQDSFSAACAIDKMITKVHAEDTEKIKRVGALIREYVDIDRIIKAAKIK